MTPLLAHHLFQPQPPIDSTESDSIISPSPQPYYDFPLFADFDSEEQPASTYVQRPLDLSVLGGVDEDLAFHGSAQSTPYTYDQSLSAASTAGRMQGADSPNPRLRIQQSSPNTISSESTPPPMHEGGNWAQAPWGNIQDRAYLSPTTSTQTYNTPPQSSRTHKRLSSGSSVGSTGPDSPFTQSSAYPHIVDPDSQSTSSPHFDSFDTSYQQPALFDKSLYYQQPSHLNSLSFVDPAFQNLNISSNDAYSMMARRSVQGGPMSPQQAEMNAAQYSTRGQFGGDANMNGPLSAMANVPKLDRTVSDVYQDELFDNSQSAVASAPATQTQHTFGHEYQPSPHRALFNDRLQQANTARSPTPSTDMSRELSPYRDSSDFAGGNSAQMPSSAGKYRINSAAQIREHQKRQEDARAYAQSLPQPTRQNAGAAADTISPKEALLEYGGPSATDTAKFSTQTPIKREPSAYAAPAPFVNSKPASVNGITDANSGNANNHNDYASVSAGRRQTPTFSSSQQSTSSNGYPFMPTPNVASGAPSYPFISQSRRQSSSMRSEQSEPQFPATLTSMESTKSESSREPNVRPPAFRPNEQTSSQRSEQASPPSRPADTSANTGSYTCAAPKCNKRFSSSVQLQRHRKESHRASPQGASPSTPASSTSQTPNPQALANNASRNTAPGPHRCERVNPGTGRPCNQVFSRSYDLTRHEETIHNSNKKKARCHLCTEEKTFSRNDALTRHMRVVHPDIDFQVPRNRRSRG